MKKNNLFKISLTLFVAFLCFVLSSCGVSKIYLDSISPGTRALNMPSFTLTATGAGFDEGAKIVVGERTMTTKYVSTTELNCIVKPEDISISFPANTGDSINELNDEKSISVIIRNSNGQESNPVDLIITENPVFITPFRIPSAMSESYNPKIAIDGNNIIYVVFERYNSSLHEYYISIVKSSDGGSSWSDPVDVFTADEKCYNPGISISSDNRINVIFYMIKLYYSCSTDNGKTWDSPVPISDDTNSPLESDIAVDSSDGINILWVQNNSSENHIYFRRSSDNGNNFLSKVDVSAEWNNYGTLYQPSIGTDSLGAIFVAWKAWPNNASRYADVYTNYSLDYGVSWKSHDARFGVMSSPDIESSPNGKIFLTLSNSYLPFRDRVVLYELSDDRSAWNFVKTVTGDDDGYSPKIKIDSIGNINIIFSRLLKYYFTRSVNGGEIWSNPVEIVEDFSAIDIALDSEGNIYVVYEIRQSGGILAFTKS